VEEHLAKQNSSFNYTGHAFMIVLFLAIVLVYLKNNFLFESSGYPYILALGLPVIVLTVLASVFLYTTYISKLE
jgi:multidrug efflux pump subunit AcrB